jgi:TatD DNase family protein
MTQLIDTHAHIYLSEFDDDIDEVIDRSKEAGIEKIFMPNIDSNSIEGMLEIEKIYKNYCVSMMGLHPCYVKTNYKEELNNIKFWLEKRPFCAIGEIGIDLHWDTTFKDDQIAAFETQINWAKDLDLPIVIHCRKSIDLTIDIVKKNQDGKLKGIFHCFSGNHEHAKKIIDLNFLLGIGGVVTFKNGGLNKVIPDIELNNIVLETDSPYLTPSPFRGKRNMPSYLQIIASKIAEIKKCDINDVARITSENAINIFQNA